MLARSQVVGIVHVSIEVHCCDELGLSALRKLLTEEFANREAWLTILQDVAAIKLDQLHHDALFFVRRIKVEVLLDKVFSFAEELEEEEVEIFFGQLIDRCLESFVVENCD